MCNRLWEGALQDWAAQWCMWCDIYKHQLRSCYLHGQSIETGPLVPIPSLAGREPSPSPDFLTWLLSLWTRPVTSLGIYEDIGSECFQEVLLLLWNVSYDSDYQGVSQVCTTPRNHLMHFCSLCLSPFGIHVSVDGHKTVTDNRGALGVFLLLETDYLCSRKKKSVSSEEHHLGL